MNNGNCTLCNQPIGPGEPAMRTAPIDVRDGRIVTLPGRVYHTGGACRSAGRIGDVEGRVAAVVA